jgi:hypothetical protein
MQARFFQRAGNRQSGFTPPILKSALYQFRMSGIIFN